jgi:hypothetical protein
MTEKKNPDPFPNLPRRGMFVIDDPASSNGRTTAFEAANPGSTPGAGTKNRGRSSSVEQEPSKLKEAGSTPPVRSKSKRASLGSIRAAKAQRSNPRAKPVPVTLAKSAADIVETPKGRGRPKGKAEPWKEAGLSKAAYYRQKAKEKTK